jgi:hypothetical protein
MKSRPCQEDPVAHPTLARASPWRSARGDVRRPSASCLAAERPREDSPSRGRARAPRGVPLLLPRRAWLRGRAPQVCREAAPDRGWSRSSAVTSLVDRFPRASFACGATSVTRIGFSPSPARVSHCVPHAQPQKRGCFASLRGGTRPPFADCQFTRTDDGRIAPFGYCCAAAALTSGFRLSLPPRGAPGIRPAPPSPTDNLPPHPAVAPRLEPRSPGRASGPSRGLLDNCAHPPIPSLSRPAGHPLAPSHPLYLHARPLFSHPQMPPRPLSGEQKPTCGSYRSQEL